MAEAEPIGEDPEVAITDGKAKVTWKIPGFRNLAVGTVHHSGSIDYGGLTWHLGLKVNDPDSVEYRIHQYRGILYKDSEPECVVRSCNMTWVLPNGVSNCRRERRDHAFRSGKRSMFCNLPSKSLRNCLELPQLEDYVIIRCSFIKVEAQAEQPQLEANSTSEAMEDIQDFQVTNPNGKVKVLWRIPGFRNLPLGPCSSQSFEYGNLTWHLVLEVNDPNSRNPRYRGILHKESETSCTAKNVKMGWILPNGVSMKGGEKLSHTFKRGTGSMKLGFPSKPLEDCLALPSGDGEDYVVIRCSFKIVQDETPQQQPAVPQQQPVAPQQQPEDIEEELAQGISGISVHSDEN